MGTRASLMLDVVFLAMFAVVIVLGISISAVRSGNFRLHKRLQLTLAGILLVAVVLFEVEMRLYGWQERAAGASGDGVSTLVWGALYSHLVFAISAALLWPVVIWRAWRGFPSPPSPGSHSSSHRLWGRVAAGAMVMTAVTGWVFYAVAFVA